MELPATADQSSDASGRESQPWLFGVSQVQLEDNVVSSFLGRGKDQPFVCLAISNMLLVHLHVNKLDMVKHVNDVLNTKNILIRINSDAANWNIGRILLVKPHWLDLPTTNPSTSSTPPTSLSSISRVAIFLAVLARAATAAT